MRGAGIGAMLLQSVRASSDPEAHEPFAQRDARARRLQLALLGALYATAGSVRRSRWPGLAAPHEEQPIWRLGAADEVDRGMGAALAWGLVEPEGRGLRLTARSLRMLQQAHPEHYGTVEP